MGLFYDSTYLLVILAALISMAVSARMNTIFSKYQTVRSYSGMTGREAAMRILHQAGIYDVTVRHVSGKLTDHYDPRTKTVNLSDAVYDSTSVAAIGVAAHECGHAVQHNTDYVPLKVRSAIVPAANLGSQLFWPLFLIGLVFSFLSAWLCVDAATRRSLASMARKPSTSSHPMSRGCRKPCHFTTLRTHCT